MNPPNRITKPSRGALCALAAIASLALLQTPSQAGGPAWLRIPVDGATCKTRGLAEQLMGEKLAEHLMQSGVPEFQLKVENGYARMPLATAKPISLSKLQATLKGSAFSIPLDQLFLSGVARLEIDRAEDLDKLSAALKVSPTTKVAPVRLEGGRISILVASPRRAAEPLFRYSDLKELLAEHGAKLLDVKWGAEPDTFGREDYVHWFCGDAFGALRVAEVEPAGDKAAKKTASADAGPVSKPKR